MGLELAAIRSFGPHTHAWALGLGQLRPNLLPRDAFSSWLLRSGLFSDCAHGERISGVASRKRPKQIVNIQMMQRKLEYIHNNPVARGYVDDPLHWRYSSARNYAGQPGLLPVTTDW